MKNDIVINNQKIELTEDQVKRLMGAYGIQRKQLAECIPGSVVGKISLKAIETMYVDKTVEVA